MILRKTSPKASTTFNVHTENGLERRTLLIIDNDQNNIYVEMSLGV